MSSKPGVTLPPSKGILTESAARLYAAYIISGCVKDEKDSDHWIRRSIREAVAIARTVDKSVLSDQELPAEEPLVHQPIAEKEDGETKSATSNKGKSNVEVAADEVLSEETPPLLSDEDETKTPSLEEHASKHKKTRKGLKEEPKHVVKKKKESAAAAANNILQETR